MLSLKMLYYVVSGFWFFVFMAIHVGLEIGLQGKLEISVWFGMLW